MTKAPPASAEPGADRGVTGGPTATNDRNEPAAPAGPTAPAALADLLSTAELAAVGRLGARDLGQLLRIPPNRYVVPGPIRSLHELHEGEEISAVVTVRDVRERSMRNRPGSILLVTVADGTDTLTLTFFLARPHLVQWHRGRLAPGTRIRVSGTVGNHRDERQIVHPDYIVLEDDPRSLAEAMRPMPVYPLRGSVKQTAMRHAFSAALEHVTELPAIVPPAVLAENGLPDLVTALRGVHAPADEGAARAGMRYLAFEEALVLQSIFAQRRAADELTAAPSLRADGPLQGLLRERLPFVPTAGQDEVGGEIARLISRDMPTSVLLQGDVGSGKTLVALLAMLRAVDSGFQAALLAPTEVLAEQHARTITGLLGDLGRAGHLDGAPEATTVRLLTGSQRVQDRRRTLLDVTSGTAGIIIGTHALLTESVEFASLGLVVIDEQHRFGVDHRRRLRRRGANGTSPHVIVMTATPIPRSAALAVVGDLDVLTLKESPALRAGVTSHVVPESRQPWVDRMWGRVREEIAAGHRAFVVCARIDEGAGSSARDDDPAAPLPEPRGVEQTAAALRADPAFAGIRIGTLHGRMSAQDKQEAMAQMAAGELDLLVATTVIEVGVDVPDATALVVLDAERFGVSQLHQLRGRVGRGEHPGIAFFDTRLPPDAEAAEHLARVAATTDGFELARLDLDRRGVGDLVGTEQSGLHRTLRHLDVMRDVTMIEDARAAARAVIASDPELESHRPLAAAIDDRLRDADPDVERS